MKNFARLGVLFRNFLGGLLVGKILQNAFGDVRGDPQSFECGDESVAAENGGEPRDTGVGILTFGIAIGEHAQVGFRALQPGVDALVGSSDLAFVQAFVGGAIVESFESAVVGIGRDGN